LEAAFANSGFLTRALAAGRGGESVKHKSVTVAMALLGVGIALSVWGDSTGLTISNSFVTLN
jgi:hypothetical protein